MHALDFEKSVAELETKIEELRHLSDGGRVNIASDIGNLQDKVDKQLRGIYGRLTPAQKVQVARHPERPQGLDYITALAEDFTPLAGDRLYGEDFAIIGGLGRVSGQSCVIIAHERGKDTDSRLHHNFGMARPEGYRKAQRLMNLADHFRLPILTFVDTAGAFPGVDAEARGQAEAIARSIETCLNVGVPLISVIIGEGGSGGAIAIAAADRVFMLEHSIYSVISPEGCASILWRSAAHAADAAAALRLTSKDLLQHGIIDRIIPEPLGGAHRNPQETIQSVGDVIGGALRELSGKDRKTLLAERREKFLAMGT
jgi:acetyl-CoA carboxylase carboxyl transferase subunit alpha